MEHGIFLRYSRVVMYTRRSCIENALEAPTPTTTDFHPRHLHQTPTTIAKTGTRAALVPQLAHFLKDGLSLHLGRDRGFHSKRRISELLLSTAPGQHTLGIEPRS
jgi:hypothetical protein